MATTHTHDQHVALGTESTFEHQTKRVAPWVFSIALHVAIGVVALFLTWSVSNNTDDDGIQIIADFNALTYEPIARIDSPNPSVGDVDEAEPLKIEQLTERVETQLARPERDPMTLLARHLATDGIDLPNFAPQPSPSAAAFVGLSSSNARKIVYVIDASGSMIPYLQVVIEELGHSLANLSPPQEFSVIFFQENKTIEMPPHGKLNLATPERKREAMKWVRRSVVPSGGTNPLLAVERAMRMDPDVIFLLSQNITGYGKYQVDQRQLLDWLNRLNPPNRRTGRRATRINCIQFLDRDPLQTMVKIAREHGGEDGFKFIDRTELGLDGTRVDVTTQEQNADSNDNE